VNGCSNKVTGGSGLNEFGQHYLEAQHDYCSTNIFIAEQGLLSFRDWLSDTNHEVVGGRDFLSYQVYGRLFLISVYVGNSNAADIYYETSAATWNKYISEIPPAPHGHEPILSKEQLRESLARHDKSLDIGWMKNAAQTNGVNTIKMTPPTPTIAREMPVKIKRRAGFSITNASLVEAEFVCPAACTTSVPAKTRVRGFRTATESHVTARPATTQIKRFIVRCSSVTLSARSSGSKGFILKVCSNGHELTSSPSSLCMIAIST
jgi:hypothetical protein